MTFLFAGVSLRERGLMLSEGMTAADQASAQTARRWTRLTLDPFTIGDEPGRLQWRSLLLAIEKHLILARAHPGMLADDLAGYLFARTTGHIGSLMTLVTRGVQRAIRRGGRSPRDLLDTVKIDEAAEQARAQILAALSSRQAERPAAVLRGPAAAGGSIMTAAPRTLPIRGVAPVPGEARDSWHEALAARLRATLADLAAAGFPARRPGKTRPASAITVTGSDAAAIAASCQLTAADVRSLTLARYDGIALRLDRQCGPDVRNVLWGRAPGPRCCPECLAPPGGRWQLSGRLGWSFASLSHS